MKIEKLNPGTDGASKDILAENIDKLRELFPEAFTESSDEQGPRWKVNFECLREILGDFVEEKKERYIFSWYGKSRARMIAQTPSTGSLRPCPEESVNWDSAKNIFIEGDNLEVLKLLQKSYHKKIKMIYIDPPYNTGKEFIYPDKYHDNLTTYLQYTGQVDSEGIKFSANSETDGRYHTNWLNMMYPRLKLDRNLLKNEGIIFVSINDREVHNLKHLMDEIFGPENWLGTIIWKNATDNNPSQIAIEHEYIHVYCREKAFTTPVWRTAVSDVKDQLLRKGEELIKQYPEPEERQAAYSEWFKENGSQLWPMDRYKYIDDHGVYIGSQSVHNPGKEGYRYDIKHPITGKACKQPLMGYRFPWETMKRLLNEGKILFGDDHNKIIELKVYAKDFMDKLPSVIMLDGRLGAYDMRNLFPEVSKLFTNPKPVKLLMELFSFSLENNDIALDFFAGSCPTAEAVLRLNQKDSGSRNFIMVQLPEIIDHDTETGKAANSIGLNTIADIGKSRIARVFEKIANDNPDFKHDLGYKVLKLDSSNIIPWDADFDNLEDALFKAVENIKSDRSESDVLYELLLKYGLDLAVPIEKREINKKTVYIIAAGALIVCLDKDITLDTVQGIAQLKQELDPAVMRVVFRDSGFRDDVVKTNTIQILKQAGIEDVKSL